MTHSNEPETLEQRVRRVLKDYEPFSFCHEGTFVVIERLDVRLGWQARSLSDETVKSDAEEYWGPPPAPAEPWMPKVGDWVRVVGTQTFQRREKERRE